MARNLIDEIVGHVKDGDTLDGAIRQVCKPYGPVVSIKTVNDAEQWVCFVSLWSPVKERELLGLVGGHYFGHSVCFEVPIPGQELPSSQLKHRKSGEGRAH